MKNSKLKAYEKILECDDIFEEIETKFIKYYSLQRKLIEEAIEKMQKEFENLQFQLESIDHELREHLKQRAETQTERAVHISIIKELQKNEIQKK